MSSNATAGSESSLDRQQLAASESELGTFWHRCRSRLVTKRLVRDDAGIVVDVGAGAGHLGAWLRTRAPEVDYRYSEPSAPLAESLQRRFGAARSFDDRAGSTVDAIVMLDVIEHVPDDRSLLERWLEHLRPGGLLVLTAPALPSLFSAWDEAMGHHRRYTKRSIRDVVADLPLEVLECSYLFPELLPPAVVRRVARPRSSEIAPEFPELPRPLDATLYGIGCTTAALRRVVPAGTSVFMAARARGAVQQ